jgi:tetratricopeptide (TPR) repeat protein
VKLKKSKASVLGDVPALIAVTCLVFFLWGCQSAALQKTGGPTDERMEQLNNAARTAFRQGNIPLAETLYGKALDHAYVRDDYPAIVDAKYNLSICRMRLGRYRDALDTVQSAKRDAGAMSGDRIVDLKLLEIQILYRLKRLDAAWRFSEQLMRDKAALSPEKAAMAHALRGQIACAKSDIPAARTELAAMGEVSGDYLRAEHAELSGSIALLEKDWQKAINAFEREIPLRRRAGHYQVMAEALARAGLAYEEAGDTGRAADRFFRAGRSAQIQGMQAEAFRWLTRAQELASRAGDGETVREARERLSQIPASPSR